MLKFDKESHVILAILIFASIAVGFISLLPTPKVIAQQLPWQIEINQQGELSVFNMTLEKTTLQQARKILLIEEELSLFKHKNNYSLEAFFQQVTLGGLKADIVLTLKVAPKIAEALYQRGTRLSKSSSGDQKITLAAVDFPMINQLPIQYLTYLPKSNLEPAQIKGRFGEPTAYCFEKDNPTKHWLYPQKGLEIIVSNKAKEVLQYVPPRLFKDLILVKCTKK